MIKVFLSSTYHDLQEHRLHCISALERLRQGDFAIEWVGMEHPDVEGESPKAESLRRVHEADVYVGIFGMRYGTIDRETDMSITDLEYREARKKELPCLIYLIDENLARIAPATIDRGIKASKLRKLKAELGDLTKGHIVRRFTSPEDLAAQLSVDIVKALRMLTEGGSLQALRDRVEQAIHRGARFIVGMENQLTGGWCYHDIGKSTTWDTAYSMLALVASGMPDTEPYLLRGQHWLMATRNHYGGWRSPWEPSPDASSTVDTAVAVAALYESGFDEQPWELERTAAYLLSGQLDDGGWPYVIGASESATASTAWAIRALARRGLSVTDEWAQRALAWLLGHQLDDGGWAGNAAASDSTIGKTRDALLTLHLYDSGLTKTAVERAIAWLERARDNKTPEEFGSSVAFDPQGRNPLVENVVYFLEAAFSTRIPAGDEHVRSYLDWLIGRNPWGFAPQAVSCLSLYRRWIT